MKALNVFILIVLPLIPLSLFAQIKSDFVYQVNSDKYLEWITQGRNTNRFVEDLASVRVHTPVNTILSGIHFKGQEDSIIQLENLENKSFNLFVALGNIEINVEQIVSDDLFQQNDDRYNLKIRVQGHCSNLKAILLNENYNLNAQFEIVEQQGRLQLKMIELAALQQELLWSVDPGLCHGPRGYLEQVLESVENKLKDRWFIHDLLLKSLETKFANLSQELNQSVLKTSTKDLTEDLKLILNPQKITFAESNALQVIGEAQLISTTNPYEAKVSLVDTPQDKDQTLLVLPSKLFNEVSLYLYKSGLLGQNFYSNDIEGFKDLMKSRFSQFFVWPDLMKFKKRTNFLFQTAPQQEPILSGINSEEGKLKSQVYNYLNLHMLAPGKQWAPYIVFESHVLTQTTAKIKDKDLILSFSDTQVEFDAHWDPTYVNQNNPSTRMAKQTIRGKLEEAVNDYKKTIALPALEFSQVKLYPAQLEIDSSFLYIHYLDEKQLRQNNQSEQQKPKPKPSRSYDYEDNPFFWDDY